MLWLQKGVDPGLELLSSSQVTAGASFPLPTSLTLSLTALQKEARRAKDCKMTQPREPTKLHTAEES